MSEVRRIGYQHHRRQGRRPFPAQLAAGSPPPLELTIDEHNIVSRLRRGEDVRLGRMATLSQILRLTVAGLVRVEAPDNTLRLTGRHP